MKTRHNGERSPEEIEAETTRIRAEMHDTLDAIQRKLSPGQMLDQALHYVSNGPGAYAHNLGEAVKQNPLPLALVGLGLGWLMMSGREAGYYSPSGTAGYGATGTDWSETAHRGGEAISGAKERAGEVAHEARERIGEMGEQWRERGGEYAEKARHQAHRMTGMMRERGGQVRSTMEQLINEQPLVLGALGIAVGAALGASLPATRHEDELLGETGDTLRHKAKQAGQEQAEKVRGAAEHLREETEQELAKQSRGPSGSAKGHGSTSD